MSIYGHAVNGSLRLKRGRVWCKRCGYTMAVDSAACLQGGWPKHCGETMTIDSPEEQAAFKAANARPPEGSANGGGKENAS